MQVLHNLNINAIDIHGGLSSRERKATNNKIKNLQYPYIVASDLASRGLDIDGVSHVISWDMYIDLVDQVDQNILVNHIYFMMERVMIN